MTTYSPALATQVGTLMAQLVPGLSTNLATTWATIESGVGNNPYGVTDGKGNLLTFPTLQAGVQAAANLLLTSSHYSGVRAALRTGDPNAVASALVASPWNTPNSAYYASHFTQAGYTIDLSTVPSAVGTETSYTDPSPAAGSPTSSSGLVNLATLLGLSASTRISASTLGTIEKKVAALLAAGTISNYAAQNIYATLGNYAKTAGTEQLGGVSVYATSGQEASPTAQGVAATVAGGALAAGGPLLVAAVILVAAAVLGYMGIQRLLP